MKTKYTQVYRVYIYIQYIYIYMHISIIIYRSHLATAAPTPSAFHLRFSKQSRTRTSQRATRCSGRLQRGAGRSHAWRCPGGAEPWELVWNGWFTMGLPWVLMGLPWIYGYGNVSFGKLWYVILALNWCRSPMTMVYGWYIEDHHL